MIPIREFRPATEQERMYTYAQSQEVQMITGMIARLLFLPAAFQVGISYRADMNNTGCYHRADIV